MTEETAILKSIHRMSQKCHLHERNLFKLFLEQERKIVT